MPASTNKRIFYAVQQVGIKTDGDTGSFNAMYGVQSVGVTTSFELNPVFEYGQLAIYQNVEDIPDVEITCSKVLDGRPLIWHRATENATAPTLVGRSNEKAIFGLSIFADTAEAADGTPLSEMQASGLFVSSLSYTFPLEDSMTEEVTLVGNHKVWVKDPKFASAPTTFSGTGAFAGNNDSPTGSGQVNQRQHLIWAYDNTVGLDLNNMVADPDATIIPPEVFGISDSGTNEQTNGQDYDAHVTSITCSTDLGREEINELGRRLPYHRFVTFPIDVTCEIEVTSTSGDMISVNEEGIYATGVGACDIGSNLQERTIRIATCEGTRVYLGIKNKLQSVNYTGGDTGGGNVSVTYTFQTQNDFTVLHVNDPGPSGSAFWNERASFLVN